VEVSVSARSLVTGGAGFIGFGLARHLADRGHTVEIVDDLSRGKADEEFNALIARPNVKFHRFDMTERAGFSALEGRFDFVYHIAAINGTRFFYEIPDRVLRVNILSTLNLLDWLVDHPCGKALFSSSSEGYSGAVTRFGYPIPTDEAVPLVVADVRNPRISYGGSKIAGELLFFNYARVHGFPVTVIRYHNVYGPRMGYDHVVPEFAVRCFRRIDPFPIYGGDETRAFDYIDDAVRATVAAMECREADGELVHIGNDREEIAMRELALKMIAATGYHANLEVHPAPPGCVKRRCPDTSKLHRLTGFTNTIALDEGLAKTLAWYRRDFDAGNAPVR
jgi:nucleoside-diphosphate-sugar epimerase